MAGRCVICNKKFKAGQRADTLYCSNGCRSVAFRKRKRVEKQLRASNLDMFQNQDVAMLATRSESAATFVRTVAAVAGRQLAEEALDAFWDLALQCGCNLAERFNRGS